MNSLSDEVLAQRMLETRERGYSLGLFLRRSASRYLLLFGYYGFVLLLLAFLQMWPGVYLMVGLTVGALAREIGWVRAIGKNWPFTVKVTDWEKIERMAEGEDVSMTAPIETDATDYPK